MKPPPRKRTKKSLELTPVPEPRSRTVCNWPKAEKRRLLSALSQLCRREALDPERVREHLPTRSAAEIKSVLETLKEKVILFAKNKYYEERRAEQRASKPLDIWIQEATAVTGSMEDVLTSAFAQVLTVSAVEPHKEHHIPTQPHPPASSASSQSAGPAPPTNSPPVTEGTTSTSQLDPGTAPPQSSVRRPTVCAPSHMTHVNYEKIYYYLATLQKPIEHLHLTPMESAIVLDLLMSLPEELTLLDCDKLSEHLSQVYKSRSSRADFSEEQKGRRPSKVPEQQEPQPAQEDSSAHTKHPPLNPFLIPISLLSRKTQGKAT